MNAVSWLMILPMMSNRSVFPGWGTWTVPGTLLTLVAVVRSGELLFLPRVPDRPLHWVMVPAVRVRMITSRSIHLPGEALPVNSGWRPQPAFNLTQGFIGSLDAYVLNLPTDDPQVSLKWGELERSKPQRLFARC
jgi:hypothetical protein